MKSTLKDVAARANVSLSLVSHALNDKPYARVAPETKERIQRIARELNYSPNAVARGLSSNRMNTIGVVLTEGWSSPLVSPYFAAVIDGILEAASNSHQNVLFSPSKTRTDVGDTVAAVHDGLCDGLLVFPQPTDSGILDAMGRAQIPFVLIGDSVDDAGVVSVDVDNVAAFENAVTYLLDQGHRRIAHLSPDNMHSAVARREGYSRAMQSRGVTVNPEWVVSTAFEAGSVASQIGTLMRLPQAIRPTALCCYNDDIALFALTALRQMELRVPGDVSVSGFDDIPAASLAGLTTVRQPLRIIGQTALKELLAQIQPNSAKYEGLTLGGARALPSELIVRQSTAKWSQVDKQM